MATRIMDGFAARTSAHTGIMGALFHLRERRSSTYDVGGRSMRPRSGRWILSATGIAVAWLIGALAAAQTAPKPQNPSCRTRFQERPALKGIPVDEYGGRWAHGRRAAIRLLGLSRQCRPRQRGLGRGHVREDHGAPDGDMVTAINQANFGGRQLVTCCPAIATATSR